MVAAVLPDIDVVGFRFGVAYADPFGHRGATHSIVFAVLIGAIGAFLAPTLKSPRLISFLCIGLAGLSHGLTDMLTNGGLGVALFWPFDETRYFFPFRPIEVSPIGVSRFLNPSVLPVLASEWLWLLLPVASIVLFVRIGASRRFLAGAG